MRQALLAYISLFCLNASLVRTAPATPPGGSGTSLVQTSNLTPPTSKLPTTFCPRGTSKNDIEQYTIPVLGTTTVLRVTYCPDLPLDHDATVLTMGVAHDHMAEALGVSGDGPLRPADDPYDTPDVAGRNCHVNVASQRVPAGSGRIPVHLTYQVALNAIHGLMDFISAGHPGSAIAEIFDSSLSRDARVGILAVRPIHD